MYIEVHEIYCSVFYRGIEFGFENRGMSVVLILTTKCLNGFVTSPAGHIAHF